MVAFRHVHWVAVALVVTARPAAAADPAPTCPDTAAITWFTPGEFGAARKAAGAQKRMLMIKGIAFGVDEAGAKSATKGCW